MGFRFRRRISLFPGVRLNVSKSGVSASVGRRGAWLTFGRGKPRVTVGLPGTGLSYTTTGPHASSRDQGAEQPGGRRGFGALLVVLELLALAGIAGYLFAVAMR